MLTATSDAVGHLQRAPAATETYVASTPPARLGLSNAGWLRDFRHGNN
jgi:hypothetical protein